MGFEGGVSQKKKKIAKKQHKQDKQHKQQSSNSSSSTIREKWNIFIASDSPAAEVPGARASRYRVYGVIGLHIGNYPEKKKNPGVVRPTPVALHWLPRMCPSYLYSA